MIKTEHFTLYQTGDGGAAIKFVMAQYNKAINK